MSYYGYPNPGAYGANYQAYAAYGAAAAAAAAANSFDQYQAAYNAAAAFNMQQQPRGNQTQNGKNGAHAPSGVSISQPAQRYDYASNKAQTNPTGSSFYAGYPNPSTAGGGVANPYNMFKPASQNTKWNSNNAGNIPFTTTPGQMTNNGLNGNKNKVFKPRRPGTQQMFYCEVCKVSCAGPQTYKEHCEGQKHKKREKMPSKVNSQSNDESANNATATDATGQAQLTSTSPSVQQQQSLNNNNNRFQRNNTGNQFGNDRRVSRNVINCELCDVACTGRDAYAAHIRGTKHQKTLKLHQKLGKPIPPDLLNPPAAAAAPSSAAQGQTFVPTSSGAAVVAAPQVNYIAGVSLVNAQQPSADNKTFVPAAPLATTTPATTQESTAMADSQDLDQDEDYNCEPVGREYIETRVNGKIVSFYCKLCDCQFNDPNAKEMHTKGKRHRIAYKKKVDPNLKVEMKAWGKQALKQNNRLLLRKDNRYSLNNKINNASLSPTSAAANTTGTQIIKPLMSSVDDASSKSQPIQSLMAQPLMKSLPFNNQYGYNNNQNIQQRHYESFEDRHIVAKHNSIYPTQEEINSIQEIVTSTEKALKQVSDQIAEQDTAAAPEPIKAESVETAAATGEASAEQSNDQQFNQDQNV